MRKTGSLLLAFLLLAVWTISFSALPVPADEVTFDDYVSEDAEHSFHQPGMAEDESDGASSAPDASETGASVNASSDASGTEAAYDENHDGDDTFVTNNGTQIRIPTVDNTERIFDYAGLFSAGEEEALLQHIEKAERTKDCCILVMTSEDIPDDRYNSSETTKDYLTEFYVWNHFPDDGFAFVIDLNNRWLYTVGHGKYGSSDYDAFCREVSENVSGYAHDGNYSGAADEFVTEVDHLENRLWAAVPTSESVAVSLAAAVIVLLILNAKHKSTMPSKENTPEVKAGGFRMIRKNSRYLGTTVTRTRIEHGDRESGGGFHGGGGGSSGGGFSGGGGSFSGGGSRF